MTWTKLSDDFTDRLDRTSLSRGARLLHVEAYIYANRMGTDGRIERWEIRKFSDAGQAELDELLAATWSDGTSLWQPLEGDPDAWQLDWSDQENAATVRSRQDLAKARQRRQRQHRAGVHEDCSPKYCTAASRLVTRDTTRDETPTRPVPTRPAPKGAGQGRETQLDEPDCSACGLSADDCRARSRTNGHEYSPKTTRPLTQAVTP